MQPTRLQTAAQAREFIVEYHPLTVTAEQTDGYVAANSQSHVSSVALFKMAALSAVSKQFERALYLDGDVLLMQDFDIASIEFEDITIAAVYDIAWAGALSTELDFFSRCEVHGRSFSYFNSGIIAADFSGWNDEIPNQYDFYHRGHVESCDNKLNCRFSGQCTWNRTFQKKWKRLPLPLNVQACSYSSNSGTTVC